MFFEKNYDHNLDIYFSEKNIYFNIYFQYIELDENFFNYKVKDYLKLGNFHQSGIENRDNYGMYDVEDFFDYSIYSPFYNFYKSNLVDIPKCFKKTKSVFRKQNNLDILKFNNYFMRKGLRYKVFNKLITSCFLILNDLKKSDLLTYNSLFSWKDFFIVFSKTNNIFFNNLNFKSTESLKFGSKQSTLNKDLYSEWDIRNILFFNIYKLLPLFAFYIYKVDKKIYKNTRGKSGKYTFIWKYVSSYKRFNLVFYWLAKELRVKVGRSLQDRLYNLIKLLVFNYSNTWIFRVKKFSNNYVYRNCRRTLAETYRTSTK